MNETQQHVKTAVENINAVHTKIIHIFHCSNVTHTAFPKSPKPFINLSPIILTATLYSGPTTPILKIREAETKRQLFA